MPILINIDELSNECEESKPKNGTLCTPTTTESTKSSSVSEIILKFEEMPGSLNSSKPNVNKESGELVNQSELSVGKLIKLDSNIF